MRRLSDLNITIEPPVLDNDISSELAPLGSIPDDNDEDDEEIRNELYPINGNISEESSESYDNNTHIASWIEGSLIGSSIFNKEEEEEETNHGDNNSDT